MEEGNRASLECDLIITTATIGIQLCLTVDKGFHIDYLISPRDTPERGGQTK